MPSLWTVVIILGLGFLVSVIVAMFLPVDEDEDD